MEKLIERESSPRHPLVAAPALAVQFFLIPLAVVGIAVLMYVGFRSLLTDHRTAEDYLMQVATGGESQRWPAAYELSRMMSDPSVRADHALGPALVKAFEQSKQGDPRVRRYLALAIGRLDPPLPADAINDLTAALNDSDSETQISAIWALGSSGDPTVTTHLMPLYDDGDAGIRKMVVYALGALPGDTQLETLHKALRDETADVRWNAAVALARHGNADGVPVLGQMLDRSYLKGVVTREANPDEDVDPISDVMISGIQAAAMVKAPSLRAPIETLSREDQSMKVREAALAALKEYGN
jgi:HEAT repeat protein